MIQSMLASLANRHSPVDKLAKV